MVGSHDACLLESCHRMARNVCRTDNQVSLCNDEFGVQVTTGKHPDTFAEQFFDFMRVCGSCLYRAHAHVHNQAMSSTQGQQPRSIASKVGDCRVHVFRFFDNLHHSSPKKSIRQECS